MLSSFYGRTSLLANNQLAAYQNPAFSIPVFSEPEGKSLGLITFGKKSRKSSRFDEFKISFFDQNRSEEDVLFINLISNDLGLLIKEEQNDYIKIAGYSEEIWIRTDDLDNLNIKYTSLDDFLNKDLKKGSIQYPSDKSLPLRSGSGEGFRKIIDLNGNDYKLEYLGLRSGNWIKVTALKYKQDNCVNQPEDLLFKIDGWVPVKDKNGDFLFHFFPNPCN